MYVLQIDSTLEWDGTPALSHYVLALVSETFCYLLSDLISS